MCLVRIQICRLRIHWRMLKASSSLKSLTKLPLCPVNKIKVYVPWPQCVCPWAEIGAVQSFVCLSGWEILGNRTKENPKLLLWEVIPNLPSTAFYVVLVRVAVGSGVSWAARLTGHTCSVGQPASLQVKQTGCGQIIKAQKSWPHLAS